MSSALSKVCQYLGDGEWDRNVLTSLCNFQRLLARIQRIAGLRFFFRFQILTFVYSFSALFCKFLTKYIKIPIWIKYVKKWTWNATLTLKTDQIMILKQCKIRAYQYFILFYFISYFYVFWVEPPFGFSLKFFSEHIRKV